MELMNFVRANWDRVGAWAAVALGAVALLVGWFGVSGTGLVFEQLPYVVSGGIGGLFLLGLGVSLLLSADLRDEWRKLDAIERHLAGVHDVGGSERPAPAAASSSDEETAVVPPETPKPRRRRRSRAVGADA